MAVTADTVEVRLEADIASYLRNLKQADSAFLASTRKMQAEAVLAGRALDIPARALNETQQQVNRFNTGNIAAQFQDIGVTAAGGMNPLLIALQQGTQLSAVLNAEIQQGQNPVKALGAAFAQVINPISLATIAAVALGAAALQYFGTLVTQGQASEEILKKQNDRIRDVADRWGDAVPALRAYVDELDRASEGADLRGAVGDAVSRQFEELRAALPDLRSELAVVRQDIELTGGESTEIAALQAAFEELAAKVQGSGAESADLDRVLKVLSNTAGSQTTASMVNLRSVLVGVSSALATAAREAQAFRDDLAALNASGSRDTVAAAAAGRATAFILAQEELNRKTADELALHNEIERVKANAQRDNETELTDAQALALATDNLAAAERRRAEAKEETAGSKAQTAQERELQAVVDMIEQLEFEYSLLGLTNEERAVANALRDAGSAATDTQRERIEELTVATMREQEAIEALDAASQEWANTIQGATRGFIDDLIEGKSAAEAFANVLSDIGSKLLDFGLNNLFGSSGFNLSGLLGGRGFPTRATGGNVYAGIPTQINERGQEIFIPTQPGRMVPASQVGGEGGVTFAPVIDARGADVAAVARLESVVQRLAADVVPTIRREIAKGPSKGRR